MPFMACHSGRPGCKEAINLGSHEPFGLRLLQQEVLWTKLSLHYWTFPLRITLKFVRLKLFPT